MTKNKLLLLIFLILFLIPSVIGYKTVQINSEANKLQIQYPVTEIYKFGTNPIKLNFHIHNSSGYLLTNTSTYCLFDLYGLDGNHIIKNNLSFDIDDNEFYFNINNTIADHIGVYPYLVDCKSNKEPGFVSNYFIITETGEDLELSKDWLPIIICLVLYTLSLGMITFIIKTKELDSIKALFFLLFVVNTLILSTLPYLISVGSASIFKPVAFTYLAVNLLVLILFIWLYAIFLIRRAFKRRNTKK